MSHCARKCRQKKLTRHTSKVRTVYEEETETDSDDDQQMMTVTLTPAQEEVVNTVSGQDYKRKVFAAMEVEGRPVKFQVDTGATCNVIRRGDMAEGVVIEPTSQTLSMYSEHKMKPMGKCQLKLQNPKNKKTCKENFVVVREAPTSILGARTVQQMELVTIQYDQIQAFAMTTADTTTCLRNADKEKVFTTYPDVFEGELGRFPGQLRLEVDDTVRKVQSPIRKIPLATKQLLHARRD